MATTLTNKINGKTYFFSDSLEKELNVMLKCNMHDEIRCLIAQALGLKNYGGRFKEFASLPYKTMQQMSDRYMLTKKFLVDVKVIFGKEAVDYLNQFL